MNMNRLFMRFIFLAVIQSCYCVVKVNIQPELKILIENEIRRVVSLEKETLKKELIQEQEKYWKNRLEAIQSKCKCEKRVVGPPGPKGPMGPPGPPGPPGKRGPIGNVLRPPVPRKWLVSIKADQGEKVTAYCRFHGNPIANVSWSINGNNVQVVTKIDENKSEVLSTAIIKNVTWSNRGFIGCFASNILGRTKKVGLIRVRRRPSIVRMPAIVYSYLGVPLRFPTCKVVAYPEAKITWKKAYGKIDTSRFQSYNNTLKISRVDVSDEGFYICEAKNIKGSAEIAVQLKTKPFSFSTRPPNYQSMKNLKSFNLTCGAYGAPKSMTGSWIDLSTGRPVRSMKRITSSYEFIMTATFNKSGEYACRISNGVSSIRSTAYVKEFSFDSSILTSNQTDLLYDWIYEKRNTSLHIDGFTRCSELRKNSYISYLSSALYTHAAYSEKCDTYRDIIMIVKDTCGDIFGGYKNKQGGGFLFSFTREAKFERLSNATNVVCKDAYGPCFNDDLYMRLQRVYPLSYHSERRMYAISSLGKNYERKGYNYLGCSFESNVNSFEILQEN